MTIFLKVKGTIARRSRIRNPEYRADLADNSIREFNRQIESQHMEVGPSVEDIRIILERQKEQFLAEWRSEILKHVCKAGLAENYVHELKRQIDSQAVEIEHARTGYEQSRREQGLLHAERERALRETRIRSVHEMEELKRAQEIRVDEFSRRRLIENHDTINEYRNCKMTSIVWMTQGIFKMSNLFAVDNGPTCPVNRRYSQVLVENRKEC